MALAQREKLPPGEVHFYTDYNNGSDTNSGSITSPWRTAIGAASILHDQYDFTFAGQQTRAVINMADNTTDMDGFHYSPHGLLGSGGGAAMAIRGGTNSKIYSEGSAAVGVYYTGVIKLENVKLSAPNGNGIDAIRAGEVQINNVEFENCAGACVNIDGFGRVFQNGAIGISGPVQYFLTGNCGRYQSFGHAININANLNMNCFAYIGGNGQFSFQSGGNRSPINMNGHSVTGKRFIVDNYGVCDTGGGGANYFPGNQAGTATPRGNYG